MVEQAQLAQVLVAAAEALRGRLETVKTVVPLFRLVVAVVAVALTAVPVRRGETEPQLPVALAVLATAGPVVVRRGRVVLAAVQEQTVVAVVGGHRQAGAMVALAGNRRYIPQQIHGTAQRIQAPHQLVAPAVAVGGEGIQLVIL